MPFGILLLIFALIFGLPWGLKLFRFIKQSSQAQGPSLTPEERAAIRREELRRLVQQRPGATNPPPPTPGNLTAQEVTARERARELYNQRAAQLRAQMSPPSAPASTGALPPPVPPPPRPLPQASAPPRAPARTKPQIAEFARRRAEAVARTRQEQLAAMHGRAATPGAASSRLPSADPAGRAPLISQNRGKVLRPPAPPRRAVRPTPPPPPQASAATMPETPSRPGHLDAAAAPLSPRLAAELATVTADDVAKTLGAVVQVLKQWEAGKGQRLTTRQSQDVAAAVATLGRAMGPRHTKPSAASIRQAVVMREILDPPVALREGGRF